MAQDFWTTTEAPQTRSVGGCHSGKQHSSKRLIKVAAQAGRSAFSCRTRKEHDLLAGALLSPTHFETNGTSHESLEIVVSSNVVCFKKLPWFHANRLTDREAFMFDAPHANTKHLPWPMA
jgi:hypothetical protein